MNKISERRVHVARYDDHISVMLAWFIKKEDGTKEPKDRFIRLNNVSMFRQVELGLNALVTKWVHVFLGASDMSLISECLDEHPQLFDCIATTTFDVEQELYKLSEQAWENGER